MPRPAAIVAGFRTAFRRPALVAGEIAWRWTLGAATWALLIFTFFAYLHSLTISSGDWLLLRTRIPPLMSQAITHILSGSGPRLLRAAAVLLPAFTLMWVVAASIGRWVSLRALLEAVRGRFRTVLGLHFLRAAGALAAWIGYLGALLAAAFAASRGPEDRPSLFLLLFLVLAALIGFFHGRLRWYLFLANIFAMRDGCDTFAAITAAFDVYRGRRGRFLSLALALGAIRVCLLIGVSLVSLAPLAVIPSTAWVLLAIVMAGTTLAYCAIADFLFVVRLAAYVEIVRDEPEPEPVLIAPSPSPEVVLPATHDLRPPTDDTPSTVDRGPAASEVVPSS